MLTPRELVRYSRQMIIPGWGKAGQEKLRRSQVLVVGAGGPESPLLTYPAAAGVGKIRVVDCDKVELSNLNRQVLYDHESVGRRKAESARERLESLNACVQIEAVDERITRANIFELVADYLIVDALDNLPTRHLLNMAALRQGLPLFHGAVYGFEGRATTVIPGETACLRCIYQAVVPGKAPVVGVTPGVIGCVQATEVVKYIMGVGQLLTNRLLVYDGLALRFSEVKLKKDPNCPECGQEVGVVPVRSCEQWVST